MGVTVTSYVLKVKEDTDRAIAVALEAVGGTAEKYAKENLTKNGSVITGNLRNSIEHRAVDKYTVEVGSKVYYAPFVELGHNQQPGRFVPAIKKRLVADHVAGKPYLRPAIENHIDDYMKILNRILRGE